MVHRTGDIPHLFLKPGEMHFATEPTLVSTLLGSCVAVIMFDPASCTGAISHCLLPVHRDRGDCSCDRCCGEAFRYVECAVRRMLEEFGRHGVRDDGIEVKLFGGADMFALGGANGERPTVGRQNVERAVHDVTKARLNVTASDTGGLRGRKIYFVTHTGEVWMKRLNRPEDD